jgi:Xaa-Pro dipeptidase
MSGVGSVQGLNDRLDRSFGPHLAALCARCARALEACGYSGLLVYAGSLLPVFEDDRTYPFEANAPFKVWVPLQDAPGSFVWFKPGSRPRLIVEVAQDYWYKPADRPCGYWVRHFDVHTAPDRAAARALLPADLSRAAYIGDAFPELAGFRIGAVNPPALMRRLDYDRAAKSPYELDCLREASRLGALGHQAAVAAFSAGASEFEIELAFLRACGLREQELPYNPIIALNGAGAILHYQMLEKHAPRERLSLLIDAGAEFQGYASDITAQVLREADLIGCSAAQAVASGVTRVFLPHGIGHLLGLEVHDVGGLLKSPEAGEIPRPDAHPYLRLTRILEEGFVVTMEPGIYFIPQLLAAARADARGRHINWSRVEALSPFGGIRIEDDLAVTREGCENLTREAFRAVQ